MSTNDIRDKIAEAICGSTGAGRMFPWHTLNEFDRDAWRAMVDAARDAWRKACTVTTVEQLDALPVGTVLREDYDGTIWTLHDGGKHIEAYRECDYLPLLTSAINLPARVLHNPDWETK